MAAASANTSHGHILFKSMLKVVAILKKMARVRHIAKVAMNQNNRIVILPVVPRRVPKFSIHDMQLLHAIYLLRDLVNYVDHEYEQHDVPVALEDALRCLRIHLRQKAVGNDSRVFNEPEYIQDVFYL